MTYDSPMKKKGSSCMQMKDYKGKPSGLMMEGSALYVESKELEAQAKKASSKLEKETGFGTKGFGESKKVEVLGSKLTNIPTYDKSAEERGLEKGYKLLESSAKGEGPYVGETMEVLKKQYTPEQAKQKLMSTFHLIYMYHFMSNNFTHFSWRYLIIYNDSTIVISFT